jgi:hypothetical protein
LFLWCHWYYHAIWIACINWHCLLPGLFCHWWHVNELFESLVFHGTIGFDGSFNLMIQYLILNHSHTLILSPSVILFYLWYDRVVWVTWKIWYSILVWIIGNTWNCHVIHDSLYFIDTRNKAWIIFKEGYYDIMWFIAINLVLYSALIHFIIMIL